MFKFTISSALVLFLGLSSAYAQDDSAANGLDDSTSSAAIAGVTLELDDAELDSSQGGPDGGELILLGKGPLAFGTVRSNGAKYKGSNNWSSSYNGTYKRYEITITSNSYYYLNYATVVTPAGDSRFCKTSSVGGKLLVYCYDHAGNVTPARFGFLTFKP